MRYILLSFVIAIIAAFGYITFKNTNWNADYIFASVLILSLSVSLILCKK